MILVEILKQDKNVPMPVEEQVVSIFLSTSNMIEHLDLTVVKKFELDLLERIRNTDSEVLKVIRETSKFSPESEQKIRAHIDALLVELK